MSSDREGTAENDPLEGLEARLHSHNRAFESLLALTPAREYYGSQIVDGRDPSEQWNRKKQTREEKRAARKAKLDPANQKSALDVMREREAEAKAKRKRNDEEEVNGDAGADGEVQQGKRRKSEDDADTAEARRREKAQKRKEKRAKKKEKSEVKKAKAEAKKSRKQERDLADALAEKDQLRLDREDAEEESDNDADPFPHPTDLEKLDVSGLVNSDEKDVDQPTENASASSSAPTTPIINSPAFDLATNHSAASSSSSISPPSIHDQPPNPPEQRRTQPAPLALTVQPTITTPPPPVQKPNSETTGTSSPKLTLPNIDAADLSARVRAKIDALRAARKADGPDGKPIKSRQELLDQRRKKQETRKANKKALRAKQKEDEAKQREERLRGSGSPLSKVGDVFSPPPPTPQYSFSKLAFEDGVSGDAGLGDLKDGEGKKKKGPQDAKTALLAAEKRDARFAAFRPEKQASVQQREMWKDASLRAQGGRGKEETSLLKKALKRKEKGKNKSEREWKEREEGVAKGKAAKQKKREANLAKRREEKGASGGKAKGKAKKGGKKGGKKGRPGFEGRFKA